MSEELKGPDEWDPYLLFTVDPSSLKQKKG